MRISDWSSDVCSSDLLEDSVAPANKAAARGHIADYLAGTREVVTLVRVNPLDGHMTAADVAAIVGARPDAIMLPKAEGAPGIAQLDTILRSETKDDARSEEHTSELQSLMRISYAVFCLKNKIKHKNMTAEPARPPH